MYRVYLYGCLCAVMFQFKQRTQSLQSKYHVIIVNTKNDTTKLQAVCASCQTQAPSEDDNVYYNVAVKVDGEAGKAINLGKSRFPNIYPGK